MFSLMVISVFCLRIGSAFGDSTGLILLEERMAAMEEMVVKQQEEMELQRLLLAEKSIEMEELRGCLEQRENTAVRLKGHLNRRFLTDSGRADDVAFFARIDAADLTGINTNQTIVFGNAVLNVGNAYDVQKGVFTSPVDGLFLFSVTLTSDLGHFHELQVALQQNDAILTRVHAHGDSGHLDQGSATVVAAVTTGDKVFVKSVSSNGSSLFGSGMTTFSGYHIMFK